MRQHALILAAAQGSAAAETRKPGWRRVCWLPLELETNYADEPAQLCRNDHGLLKEIFIQIRKIHPVGLDVREPLRFVPDDFHGLIM